MEDCTKEQVQMVDRPEKQVSLEDTREDVIPTYHGKLDRGLGAFGGLQRGPGKVEGQ